MDPLTFNFPPERIHNVLSWDFFQQSNCLGTSPSCSTIKSEVGYSERGCWSYSRSNSYQNSLNLNILWMMYTMSIVELQWFSCIYFAWFSRMELVRRHCSKFVEKAITLSLIQCDPRHKKVISASFSNLVGCVFENRSVIYIQCNCVVLPQVDFVIHLLVLKQQKLKRLKNSFTKAFRIWIRGRYAFPLSRFVPYVLVFNCKCIQ